MSFSKWLFATWYDLLNMGVEPRLTKFRKRTAGQTWGDVLEIGGGTGANLKYFPPETNLTFAEPDKHMRKRLAKSASKIGREIKIEPCNGEDLPFPDASFDCVLTTLVLCMVEDHERVISEARRVLKPGGAFFFYEHVISPRPRGIWWQNKLNPFWKFVTTGCNLNRDLTSAIESTGFKSVEFEAFDLSVGVPVTIPNILGVARV